MNRILLIKRIYDREMRYKINFILIILIALSLALSSCTIKSEKNKIALQMQKLEKERSDSIKKVEAEKQQRSFNDSVSSMLLKKYPNPYYSDSIVGSLTFYFQKKLEETANLLYIDHATLTDIKRDKDHFVATITGICYYPKTTGRFIIKPDLFEKIRNELNPHDKYARCCLIVKVTDICVILDSSDLKSYLLNGEIIELCLLK